VLSGHWITGLVLVVMGSVVVVLSVGSMVVASIVVVLKEGSSVVVVSMVVVL